MCSAAIWLWKVVSKGWFYCNLHEESCHSSLTAWRISSLDSPHSPPPALLPSFPFLDAESRSPGTRPSQVIVLCFASLYPRVWMRTGELSGKSDEMQGGGEPCNGLASHRGWGGGKYYYSSSLLSMNNVVSQAAWATRLGYRLRFTKFGTRNK